MKIAITGGTGFVGWHLAQTLVDEGHDLVLLSRGVCSRESHPRITHVASDLSDAAILATAFSACEAVAHCAGINRELGSQTYQRVHIEGTWNVVQAAQRSGVRRLVLMSFLRARPGCGSLYHESKWAAEEIVRNSALDYTIVKAGMVYGRGDHMLDHLTHSLCTIPLFATVGLAEKPIRPLAIEDLIVVMRAALVDGQLPRKTVSVTGAEQLYLSDAVRRVADVLQRPVWVLPAPIFSHCILAQLFEWMMKVPLVAKAQVQILAEGVVETATECDPLPLNLAPTRCFTPSQIRGGLPEPRPFSLHDLRCCS